MMQPNGASGQAGRVLSTLDFVLDISHSKYESLPASLSAVVTSRQSMHW
jgi:hypothetical protein